MKQSNATRKDDNTPETLTTLSYSTTFLSDGVAYNVVDFIRVSLSALRYQCNLCVESEIIIPTRSYKNVCPLLLLVLSE